MKRKLKKIIEEIKQIIYWYKITLRKKSDWHIPFYKKCFYLLKGFSVDEYYWYNLNKNNSKNYISEYERLKSRKINGEYKIILDDKLLFEEIFRNYVKTPKIYAWISNKNIYGLHGENINNNNYIEFLKEKEITILKAENRGGGNNVYKIEKLEKENSFLINGKELNEIEVRNIFQTIGKAILCEYIKQCKFENELYPYSTNTIRIVCAKKKDEKESHIIKAVQRIGNECSSPVDNICKGGFASEINIETGELGSMIAPVGQMERRLIWYENHPDTNMQIKGKFIPNWQEIKSEVVNLTNQFPYLNFVAWDVCLTEEGICIIEGNASSGANLHQMKHGVKNEELGDIYRSYQIIK